MQRGLAPEILRRDHLVVLDAKAHACALRGRQRRFGRGERLQCHCHRPVADGMKADLKSEARTFDRHLIEAPLRVARNAALVRVVAVGLLEGGSARAQGAVHETLEHPGMQHGVVMRMGVALANENCRRIVKRQPLADTQRQRTRALHLLVNEKVFPLRVVLCRGHAVSHGVAGGELERVAALLTGGGRNAPLVHALGGLAQDPGERAVRVPVEPATGRIGSGAIDPPRLQGGAVDHGDMSVHALEECRVTRGHAVEIASRRQPPAAPDGVVPAAATNPGSGRSVGGTRAHARQHLLEGARAAQVALQGERARGGQMQVGVVEAGHDERPVQIEDLRPRTFEAGHFLIRAREQYPPAADGERSDALRQRACERLTGEDVPVQKNLLGEPTLGRQRCSRRQAHQPRRASQGSKPLHVLDPTT